ncbi:MAG: alpha/beta fold hydrolase [Gemmobacter sp.]
MTAAGYPAAPYLAAPPEAPAGGHAVWLTAADGVRARAAIWPEGSRGTVLILPGRTEHAEKYVRAAAAFAAAGLASIAIDWRGQGLADRALPDRLRGHVGDFAEYQRDLGVMIAAADAAGLPGPRYLLAHSMGGAIGLRALMSGLPVRAAAFSAPMWGIQMPGGLAGLFRFVARTAVTLGRGDRYVPPPATGPVCYAATAAFDNNVLTSDPDGFAWMQAQLRATPDLQLGGPTFGWLAAALTECAALARLPSPPVPCLTTLGTRERVVDQQAVRARMARWPGGVLEPVAGAEHEVLMEGAATREAFMARVIAHFTAA